MKTPRGPGRCCGGRDARREPQSNSQTIRKARNNAGDRASRRRSEARPGSAIDGPPALRRFLGAAAAAGPAKPRPQRGARKRTNLGGALLVEQNERSTSVARLAPE